MFISALKLSACNKLYPKMLYLDFSAVFKCLRFCQWFKKAF
ncbi:unknown protein [Cronobacter turicensis z3032]|uniref:Uncharacterized protein n=1 Tax=Cronobacter turicensis (strain DSM 18703 / CCUG 55852 / LMG 23827 / z3032) TaxID=693216 RepID=C9XV61_CROTZ|nr:unknown protein [Cronobacter turicensis z3032]